MPIKAIHSKQTVIDGKIKDATIFIDEGKIIRIEDGPAANSFDTLTELNDLVLMPGVIDPHVHINEPGRTDWEGFDTATIAAIAGGLTTLVEMPLNASPVTTTADAFDLKIKSAQGKLHSNCGFWGGIVPGNTDEIKKLADKGVLGFKAFLTHSGIDEFPNVTADDLHQAMPVIASLGLPLLVHCEFESPLHIKNTGNEKSYQGYLASRPKKWEDDAIAMMIRLCEQHHCRTHIVHLSSADSIEQINVAKQKGLPLTVETAQHYLYFDADQIEDGRTAFKCAPPIRDAANNQRLWEALQNGIIDFVATDHSPAPPAMKEIISGNLMKAWGGISSLQFALPILWTKARQQNCSISDIAKWLCEKPSILAGLQTRKGKIAVGFDADLVAWNPGQSFKVTENLIQHKHKITPYLLEELYGTTAKTWLNGEIVFDEGKINKGKGEIIFNKH